MLKTQEVPTNEIAALTVEMNEPRIAASARALKGYVCSRCGCQFPETRPPKGRTAVESRRLEKAHAAREFALHVCGARLAAGKKTQWDRKATLSDLQTQGDNVKDT